MHTDDFVLLSCGGVVLTMRLQVLRSLTKNEDLIGVLTYMWADYVSTKYCNHVVCHFAAHLNICAVTPTPPFS